MQAGKLFPGLFLLGLARLAYGAGPIVIGSTTYLTTSTTESVTASFTSATGQATAKSYSGYVLVTISGTGQSDGTRFNDAIYVLNPPSHDASYYQLRYSNAAMAPFQPQFDAYNFIVYDAIVGLQVAPPYTPKFQSNNTYSFVLPVPGGGPSQLYFGVSDGDFSDNSGSYSITVTQLQASPSLTVIPAPTPGLSTNMVSGTQWPSGDPFLQRQNEPSMAISSRNPLHVVAGDNDYRTVDLPFVSGAEETGDAWLGFFTSYDGGQTWTSTLVPGYPQDVSAQGLSSPIHGLNAGADPGVRPGPNGMFLYSGLAFNRDESASSIFVARYTDDNNLESGNSIRYLDTQVLAQGSSRSSVFLDKPAIAVDIPRGTNTCSIPGPNGSETIPAFNAYVAYTRFTGPESQNNAQIVLQESQDCGVTWSSPINVSNPSGVGAFTNQGAQIAIDPNTGTVFVFWRIFANTATNDGNAIKGKAYPLSSTGQVSQATFQNAGFFLINPFDQGTTDVSFRTNAYPAIAIDNDSNLYVAWSQRGVSPNGDARIVIKVVNFAYGSSGVYVKGESALLTVDPYSGPGHQIMPALAYSAGKLTAAWYDFRDDDQGFIYTALGGGAYSSALSPLGTLSFSPQIADPPTPGVTLRHTVDVRASQTPSAGLGGDAVNFSPSVLVSQYAYGSPAGGSTIEQLEYDAPNLPLFEEGSAPFVGDYIDIAGPTFVYNSALSAWRYNNLPTDADYTRIVWTDNRNVIPPADGNWANYTPVALVAGTQSIYDPMQTLTTSCAVGQTGMRNQDIFTASLSPGLVMGALGNAKPLSTTLVREFAVTVQNAASQAVSYRLTIVAQPPGGMASFVVSAVQAELDITIPALSSASRSVYITSSNATASVVVEAQQISGPGASGVVPNGLSSSVTLNPDVSNPNISNPNISNPNISNPNISNAEVYNPNISNPNISNPNISNPNISNPNISNPNISNITIANPNISNPNISNPNISNPNISNPNISNPNISNPNISNAALTDANYIVTNNGNTTTTYDVQLLQNQPTPNMVDIQLVVSGIYTTPVANSCSLAVEAHYVPLLNVTSPALLNAVNVPNPSAPPDPNAYTVALAPGEQIMVTVRAFDFTTNNDAAALSHYNPGTAVTPVVVSSSASTGATAPSVSLTITTTAMNLSAGSVGTSYSLSLQAIGGSGSGYSWSATTQLPPGLSLTSGGVLQGTPTAPGSYTFSVQLTDSNSNTTSKTLTLPIYETPMVQLVGPAAAVYGTSFTVAAQASSGDTAKPAITASGACQITGTTVKMTSGGGTCQLTGLWPASGYFTSATATLQIQATKASLTVTANSPTPITFGQAIPALTASFSGFVLGDSLSSLTGSPSVTTTATQYSLPGSYAVLAAQGTLASANYTFVFVNGTLTINATGSVPAAGTACNGAYTGTFSGNIIVSAGQICEIDGGQVSGNLISNGGIVVLANATVTGNVQISGTATGTGATLQHQVCGSTLQSNMQFQGDANPLVIGGAKGASCGPVSIGGNLQVLNNSAQTSMSYVTVKGGLQVENNSAGVVISNDAVTGDLQAIGNTGPVAVTNNAVQGVVQVENNSGSSTTVSGNSITGILQCSGNNTITGSGNTASQKQGQCSGF